MIDPRPLSKRFRPDFEDAEKQLQEGADDEYGYLPEHAVLTFWWLNTLGVCFSGVVAGGLLFGIGGAFAGGLLGGLSYAVIAASMALLTEITGSRLSRTVAISTGILAATAALNAMQPVEPIERVAAFMAGGIGAAVGACGYREYLAAVYHCPRFRFTIRGLLMRMGYVAFASVMAGQAFTWE